LEATQLYLGKVSLLSCISFIRLCWPSSSFEITVYEFLPSNIVGFIYFDRLIERTAES
jgi:hypothetical protein